jgi:FKBP-type peptidyl-prolyl cis-trans isomerase
MRRILAIIAILTATVGTGLAQEPDFVYTHPAHPTGRASFRANQPQFEYYAGNHRLSLTIPTERTTAAFIELAKQGGNKLTATDMCVIMEALVKWDSAKVYVGTTRLPNGLAYRIDTPGSGATLQNGQNISVHYRGRLPNGQVFDSSFERGQPISLVLGQGRVIQGWEQGLLHFKVGSKGVLVIPPDLGYGMRGAPPVIPPGATLIFDIEVVSAQ